MHAPAVPAVTADIAAAADGPPFNRIINSLNAMAAVE